MRHKKNWKKVISDHRKTRLTEATLKVRAEKSEQVASMYERARLAKKNNHKAQILKHANPQNRYKGETGFHDDDEFNRTEEDELVLSEDDNENLLSEYGLSLNFLVDLDPEAITKNEIFEGSNAYKKAKLNNVNNHSDTNDDDDSDNDDSTEKIYEMRQSKKEIQQEIKKKSMDDNDKKLLPIRSKDGKRWLNENESNSIRTDLINLSNNNNNNKNKDKDTKKDTKVLINKKNNKKNDIESDKKEEEIESEVESEIEEEMEEEMEEEIETEEKPISRRERLIEAKETLAKLAQEILTDSVKNVSLLKKVYSITLDRDPQIQKLAMLTQLAIYKDIIPGYKIRKLDAQELSVKVSKEIKINRNFEQSLLSSYQLFLQRVEKIVKNSLKKDSSDKGLAIVGMRTFCELLLSVPHFNFSLNIMTSVVNRMSLKSPNEIGMNCCETITKLFKEDKTSEFSLEVVKLIFKICKVKDFNIPSRIIQTFLSLRLREELVIETEEEILKKENEDNRKKRKLNQKLQQHKTRKQRKIEKEQKTIDIQIKTAEMSYDKDNIKKNQTETLKYIFMIYFRVLKRKGIDTELMSFTLEGLAKYSHLINVEFFADLLNILKLISKELNEKYINGVETERDNRNSFHCIIAAFQLMNGQPGDYLKLDLQDFYISMYNQLLKLPCSTYELTNNEIKNNYFGGDLRQSKISNNHHLNNNKDLTYDNSYSKTQFELAIQGFELLFYRKRQVSKIKIKFLKLQE